MMLRIFGGRRKDFFYHSEQNEVHRWREKKESALVSVHTGRCCSLPKMSGFEIIII